MCFLLFAHKQGISPWPSLSLMEKRPFFPDPCLSCPTDSLVLLRILYVCQLTLGAPVVEFARITQRSVRLQLVLPSMLQAPGHLQGPSVCDARTRAQRKSCLSVLGGTSEAPYCLLREIEYDGMVEILYAVCLKGSNINADAAFETPNPAAAIVFV